MVKIVLSGLIASVGMGFAALLGGLGGVAAGSPGTAFAVQDGSSGRDGASIDADGTQGSFKPATDGTTTGPLIVAVPKRK
jgi:hypothetical protein